MTDKTGFEKRTEAKKRHIIQAAKTLFFTKGPGKTTIAEIATEAGVSQVSIYNYFKSKDALLEIIVREHLETSLQAVEKILDMNIPFKEKLNRFFALGEEAKDDITDESLHNFDWQSPKLQEIYDRFSNERQIPFWFRFFEMGKAEGAIHQDLNPEALMAFFNANMSIYKDPNLLSKGKTYLESLSHLFFYGMIGK